jgi:hypothetical protein
MLNHDPYWVIAAFFSGVLFWIFFCHVVGRAIAQRAVVKTETAPKGRYSELREQIERAERSASL